MKTSSFLKLFGIIFLVFAFSFVTEAKDNYYRVISGPAKSVKGVFENTYKYKRSSHLKEYNNALKQREKYYKENPGIPLTVDAVVVTTPPALFGDKKEGGDKNNLPFYHRRTLFDKFLANLKRPKNKELAFAPKRKK